MKEKTNRILIFLFLAALIFILGFILASLQQKQQWDYPPAIVQTDSIKTSTLLDRGYFNLTLETINSAQKSIDIAMFEFRFYESNNSHVRQLLEALIDAHNRGVEVRALLDASDWSYSHTIENKKTVDYLIEKGVNAKLDTPFTTMHSKIWIIDDSLIIGSTNLGYSAVDDNNEASILIENKEIADEYRDYFEYLWS